MKKILLILCLLFVFSLTLTACDTTSDSGNDDKQHGIDQSGDNEQGTHAHAFGDWTLVEAASCYTKGTEKRSCSCGAFETRDLTVTEHTYTDGACSVCHATEGLKYVLNDDESAYILAGLGEAAASDIVVPAYHLGKPVIAIKSMAFSGDYGEPQPITSVKFAEGCQVESIGDWAFEFGSLLMSIELPDSLTSIGYGAFYGCKQLTAVKLPQSVTYIGGSAFKSCNQLSYTEYGGAKYLGNDENLYLYLAEITDKTVTSFDIPTTTKIVGSGVFKQCTALCAITVPVSVVRIGENAFEGCTSLTSVTLSEGLLSIGYQAFMSCSAIQTLVLPATVTEIDVEAFSGCDALVSCTLKSVDGWIVTNGYNIDQQIALEAAELTDTAILAGYFTDTYVKYGWNRTAQ